MNLIETYRAEFNNNKIEVYENGKKFVTKWFVEMRNGEMDVSEKNHTAYSGVEKQIKKAGYLK